MKINHMQVKIMGVKNRKDGTCVIEVGARSTDIYKHMWEELTRRKMMEIFCGPSDYGINGMFVAQNEIYARQCVRDVKEGKIARTKNEDMHRTFKFKSKPVTQDAETLDQVHQSWKLEQTITIRQTSTCFNCGGRFDNRTNFVCLDCGAEQPF